MKRSFKKIAGFGGRAIVESVSFANKKIPEDGCQIAPVLVSSSNETFVKENGLFFFVWKGGGYRRISPHHKRKGSELKGLPD